MHLLVDQTNRTGKPHGFIFFLTNRTGASHGDTLGLIKPLFSNYWSYNLSFYISIIVMWYSMRVIGSTPEMSSIDKSKSLVGGILGSSLGKASSNYLRAGWRRKW